MNYNQIFIRCSQHFLTEAIPETHLELDEYVLHDWLEKYASEPYQYFLGYEIYKAIEQVAMDVQQIIKEVTK